MAGVVGGEVVDQELGRVGGEHADHAPTGRHVRIVGDPIGDAVREIDIAEHTVVGDQRDLVAPRRELGDQIKPDRLSGQFGRGSGLGFRENLHGRILLGKPTLKKVEESGASFTSDPDV